MSFTRCTCSTPAPIEVEGREICETCGELLAADVRDRLLAATAREVASLKRKVAALEVKLAERPSGNGHRRLTQAKRRQLIADAIRQAPEQSNRELARQLGVSHPTIAAVRRKLAEVESGAESLSRKGSA